jgi:hypothetical protein
MPSFQRLGELTLAIDRAGGIATAAQCRVLLRFATVAAAAGLLADAEAAGLVELEQSSYRLRPAGSSLAAAFAERLASTQRRSLEAFQPYTTYVPERWWP